MRWTILGFGFLLGCGGSSGGDGAGPGTGGTSSGTSGGTTATSGGSTGTTGGSTGTTGGSTGTTGGTSSGSGGSPGGTCTEPGTYSGPALTKGAWVDVTGSLSGVQNLWGVPNQDKILAAVPANGLWAYSAAGGTWSQLAGTAGLDVMSLTFDPCNGDRFWFAANGGSGGGFYTEDGGTTVTKLGSLPGIRDISPDLKVTNGQSLVAAASTGWPWDAGTGQLWTSNDGGMTWTERTDAIVATNGTPFGYVYAVNDQTFVASTILNGTFDGGGSQGGQWITTDAGESWAQAPWKPGPRCDGYAWGCSYSGWNQGKGQPFIRSNGDIWWVNGWYNSIFESVDGGATWWDTWGEYDHSLQGGGGRAIEIPAAVLNKSDGSDPGIIAIDHDIEHDGTITAVKISYFQPNKDGQGLWWWADFAEYPVGVAEVDSKDHTDQLAFDSVASAMFVSTKNGSGLVWMYPL